MRYHAKAALTVGRRQELQRLNKQEGWTVRRLAAHFHINPSTVQRWLGRTEFTDRSSAPKQHGRRVVSDAYRTAVLAARDANPHHGPVRIAQEVRSRFPTANRTTVWRILHHAGRCERKAKKTDTTTNSSRSSSGSA
jgi:transposase